MLPQLTAEQVHAALPWDALARALEQAFIEPPTVPVRHAHGMSPGDTLLLMPAWSAEWIGLKVVTVIAEATRRGGRTVEASYLLLDRATGAPRALLDGEALTVRRTAATSALAARALVVREPRTLLVVGTGRLAPYMVQAYRALLPSIDRVLVWGRRALAAEQLAQSLMQEGHPARPVDTLEDAVRAAQVITCVTTATAPLLRGAWLQPGQHVDLVGGFTPHMREADDDVIRRARVVVDARASALEEAGDLVQPIERGVITRSHVIGELGELLRGDVVVRRDVEDITVFKSVGHALEDLAAAVLASRVLATTVLATAS